MGPGMSARNIALLRSHWTSTILPISVSQTQRSAGLLLGAAHGVFGSCHVRPLQTDSFQNSPLSPIRAKAASASDALFGRQAGLRRSPYHSFARRQPCCKPRTPPRGRFHCLHQRFTCCSDRNRSMVFHVKTIIWPQQSPVLNRQQHLQIAAAAGRIDPGILSEHRRDAKCVPNAVGVPGPSADSDRKGSGHGGKRSGTPQLTILLKHKGVTRAQSLENRIHLFPRLEAFRHLGNTRRATFRDHMAIDEKP